MQKTKSVFRKCISIILVISTITSLLFSLTVFSSAESDKNLDWKTGWKNLSDYSLFMSKPSFKAFICRECLPDFYDNYVNGVNDWRIAPVKEMESRGILKGQACTDSSHDSLIQAYDLLLLAKVTSTNAKEIIAAYYGVNESSVSLSSNKRIDIIVAIAE